MASDDDQIAPLLVSVDVVLLTITDDRLGCLVHRRPEAPAAGLWALPGGFVRRGERLSDAATRVLRDKAATSEVWLEQLYTFGDPQRDPRRVVSVAHLALVDLERFHAAVPDSPQIATAIVEVDGDDVTVRVDDRFVPLAFDHERIVAMAVTRLRGKLDWTPVGYQLLPQEFTLRQLRHVHEVISGRELTASNFRRSMLASGDLEATGNFEEDTTHRPAERYRFRPR